MREYYTNLHTGISIHRQQQGAYRLVQIYEWPVDRRGVPVCKTEAG